MTRRVPAVKPRSGARARVAAALAAAALAACGGSTASSPIANLGQPCAVAVFRGVTVTHPTPDRSGFANPYSPHLAIADAENDALSIADAVTDVLLPSPVPLHGLVYPVAFFPTLVAAADLGDQKPDLLVAVSGGDSRLKLLRTWLVDGAVVDEVELGAPVVALLALAPDPAAPAPMARVVAALSDGTLAIATFQRSTGGDGTGIFVPNPTPVRSAPLGFQPVDLTPRPGDPATIYAATPDAISGVFGVARIDVGTTTIPPTFAVSAVNAVAPTRLVAAVSLVEAPAGSTVLDPSAFPSTATPQERVYAVLDERGCGFNAPIACGIVVLDPSAVGTAIPPDPSDDQALYKAPIQVSSATGLAISGPPAVPPDTVGQDPLYAVTYLRMVTNVATRATTAAAAVMSSADGSLTYVDLGHYEIPSQVWIHPTTSVGVVPVTPPAADQWLTLLDPGTGTTVSHLDPTGLATAVGVTPGYTPSDSWTVTNEGVLPMLASRRAEVGWDPAAVTSLWLAMQVTTDPTLVTDPEAVTTTEVVNLFDPVLGVHAGDIVVFDPAVVGTCDAFEASVVEVAAPDSARFPGGAVRIDDRVTSDPAATADWAQCMDLLRADARRDNPRRLLRATIRAGGYVLVRGAGQSAIAVGRPRLGQAFTVQWQNETALAAACLLPPARPWLAAGAEACVEGSGCRSACEQLIQARLSRRLSYLTEADEPSPAHPDGAPLASGPALRFTLALETAATPERDLQLILNSAEGRSPFKILPPLASITAPGQVVAWDRSPYTPSGGFRFFAPYLSGVVVDTTPTLSASSFINSIR